MIAWRMSRCIIALGKAHERLVNDLSSDEYAIKREFDEIKKLAALAADYELKIGAELESARRRLDELSQSL